MGSAGRRRLFQFALVVGLAACSVVPSNALPEPDPDRSAAVPATTTDISESRTVDRDAVNSTTVPAPSPTTPQPTIRGGVPVGVIATDRTGSARVQSTPFVLRDRNIDTIDLLPPPPDDGVYRSTISPLSPEIGRRSTWNEDCPVTMEELSYLQVSFIGFDDRPHTGELIVHVEHAEAIAGVFGALFEARFPIEEMRIVGDADLVPPHLGDTNNTSSFVCRRVTGGSRFSEHASGLAIDINPFHNPYVKGRVVIPALSGSFGDRGWDRRGMIADDDVVVRAFAAIGWKWGGDWRSLKDYQHFSHNGR